MIGFVALTAMNQKPQESATQALREAANIFYQVEPYPESLDLLIGDARDAYRQILLKYGHVPAARAGLARCLFYQGYYAQAETEFKFAGPGYKENIRQAEQRRRLVEAIRPHLRGKVVLEVVPVPGTPLSVALVGQPGKPDDWKGELDSKAQIWVVRGGLSRPLKVIQRRPALDIPRRNTGGAGAYPNDEDPCSADLYLVRRSSRSKHWSILTVRIMEAADCHPVTVQIVDITAHGLGKLKEFGSVAGAMVFPPKGGQGLTVYVAPTFKVWWPDTYEWKRARFVLANAQHPKLYTETPHQWTEDETEHYYPLWMERAAVFGIHGQYKKALYAWKRAKRSCEKTIRTGGDRGDHSSEYRDIGFYGQARINLREIRERILWLRRHEYGHPLLYRPYDFDLQVPPYRLGPARGVQYGG